MPTGSTKKKVMSTKMCTTSTASTNGGGGGGGGEEEDLDLISKLPDSLLHHILSYLDMSTVIQRCCFLSRRWRYIWSSLPFLNFDGGFHSSSSSSVVALPCFITRALAFRNRKSNIQTFRVSHWKEDHNGEYFNISTHIVTWMHILNRICTNNNNVLQVFDLHEVCPNELIIKLPACFESLTTLKLDLSYNEMVVPDRPRPSFFKLSAAAADDTTTTTSTSAGLCLPALKTLHFKSMCFKNWVDVKMLIAGSPVLENLVFSNCLYQNGSPHVWHTQLQSLVIDKMYSYEEISYTPYYSPESCRLNVFAPKLKSFISRDHLHLINSYSFVNVSSLDSAEIYTVLDSVLAASRDRDHKWRALKKEVYIANVIDCLRGIYNVRSLKISASLLELVTEVPESMDSLQINPFCNLSFLTLKITFSKHQISAIPYLLEKCPNLEYLILKPTESLRCGSKWKSDEGWKAELAPQCMMHHLRLVEIWDVLASVNELEFLKFLLKNAIVLEKMTVFASKGESADYKKRFRGFSEKLKSFRGASTSSEILFV